MKYLVLILTGLCAFITHAKSGGVGNGGDAIVCKDRVLLLDTYEAKKMRLDINLNPNNISSPTWRTMVNEAVSRVEKFDKSTAGLLYDYAMEMVNDFEKFQKYPNARGSAVYLGYDVLTPVNDSLHVSVPENCEKFPRQMVIQRVPKFRREFRYEFSKSLWDQLSLQDQAMTILHEAWYRIMLENGAKDSRSARYMNGLTASTDFESYTFEEYIEELKGTEIQKYTILNYSEILFEKEIYFNLKEHKADFKDDELCIPNFILNPRIKETYTLINRSQKYIGKLTIPEVCVSNSNISRIELPKSIINPSYTIRFSFFQLEFLQADSKPIIEFHSNGALSGFKNIKFNYYMPMFYICDGKREYKTNTGCEEGPFIDHDKKIKLPKDLRFSTNETLLTEK